MTATLARVAYTACPLCSAEDLVDLREDPCRPQPSLPPELLEPIVWRGCEGCGHIFTAGYFEGEALESVLSVAHDHQTAAADLEGARYEAALIVDRVSGLLGGNRARWLEVGFGSGALLATAAEYGFEVVGIDARNDSTELLGRLGYDARCADFTTFEDERGFDVISMCDVLEHLPFPGQALERARGLLPQGGLLFVSLPNTDSLPWKLLDAQGANPYWSELEHYHNFSREHLFWLLERHGFQPVHYGVSRRYRAAMEVVAVTTD